MYLIKWRVGGEAREIFLIISFKKSKFVDNIYRTFGFFMFALFTSWNVLGPCWQSHIVGSFRMRIYQQFYCW